MSKDGVLQVGVAGAGFIGPAHVEALRRLNIYVAGLVDSSPETCAQKAQQLGIPVAYRSFDDMIADPAIDVVHLATPNILHYPQAKAALQAGKHVLCEKPLAMNTLESAELVELAAGVKRVNAVCFNLRFYPTSQHARALVQSGALGDLFMVHGGYLQDWLLFPTDWNWRLEPALGGELRTVGDIGSHWLDLMTFVTGQKVVEVFADFATFHPVRKKPAQPVDTFNGKLQQAAETIDQPIHTEDYASILLHYENGMRGQLTVSQVCSGRKNNLTYEINGSKSSVAWNAERPNEIWIGHRDRPNELLLKDPALMAPEARQVISYPGGHNEGYPDTFKQLAGKFYRYLLAGDFDATPDFPTFADGHYAMLLTEAVGRSAKARAWTQVA